MKVSTSEGQAFGLPADDFFVTQPRAVRRQRAHRWAPADGTWLSRVQTAGGRKLRVLNISTSGMLVESSSMLAPNSLAEFNLFGPAASVVMPARVVRSEVAAVDSKGVTYHAAAAFDRNLDLFQNDVELPTALAPTSYALAKLLVRVGAEISRNQEPAVVRATFEQGLRRLVPACTMKIREAPAVPTQGAESIYFTVPDGDAICSNLQVTFEPNDEPAADEFTMLRAAAAAAAIILLYERASNSHTDPRLTI